MKNLFNSDDFKSTIQSMKILICGFMGAGKSTFLKKLATQSMDFECIDLDHALANDLGIHPDRLGTWILENGFPLFRDREKSKLKFLLNHPNSLIIALGGGTLNPEVMNIIQQSPEVKLVFLDIPFELCLARLKSDKLRPLSALSDNDLLKLYQKRVIDYQQADLILTEKEIKEIDGLESLVHNLLKVNPWGEK